jgi:phosphonoacetaldehyde hydrolase
MKSSIALVVFDWAGTTVDFGSRAPAAAFQSVFATNGVEVTDAEARAPMGLNKREHLIAMLTQPRIASLWQAVHGRPWNDQDVDQMYHQFMPLQLKSIAQHCELVPGLLETVAQLRAMGCKIAGTTGYFREAAQTVAAHAETAGFKPDANLCADDVPDGRPAPWMIYRAMEITGVYPPDRVVNVGDTIADIHAGLNAGCWSIGVCDSSSLLGLAQDQYAALSDQSRGQRLDHVAGQFTAAGSHATIATLAHLPALVKQINDLPDQKPRLIDPLHAAALPASTTSFSATT